MAHLQRNQSFAAPLPLGTFPNPGSSYWKLFMHYVVDIWPHGQGAAGCSFNLQIDGPTNAPFL